MKNSFMTGVEIESIHVATVEGCRVFAVRREFGYGATRSYGSACGTYYWTSVIETIPGRDKTMAFVSKRFYGSWNLDDDRDACIKAARVESEARDTEKLALEILWNG